MGVGMGVGVGGAAGLAGAGPPGRRAAERFGQGGQGCSMQGKRGAGRCRKFKSEWPTQSTHLAGTPGCSGVFVLTSARRGRASIHHLLAPHTPPPLISVPLPRTRRYVFDADVNDARVVTVPRLDGFRIDVEAVK